MYFMIGFIIFFGYYIIFLTSILIFYIVLLLFKFAIGAVYDLIFVLIDF